MACLFSALGHLVSIRRRFAKVRSGKINSCNEERRCFLGSRAADRHLAGSLQIERYCPSCRATGLADSECLKQLSIDLFRKQTPYPYIGVVVSVPPPLRRFKPTPKPTPRAIPAMTTSNSVASRIDLMDLLCGLSSRLAFVASEAEPPRLLGLWCSSGTASVADLS